MKLTALIPVVLAISIMSPAVTTARKPNTAAAVRSAINDTKAKSTILTILYSASAEGQIRSCNCTKFRYGGYGRELTLLKSIRASSPNVLLIEGGDACAGTGFQADLKAGVTAKAMGVLDYDAMIPGEEELGARGVQYINRFDPKSMPIVCANLFKEGGSRPIYEPYTILKTSDRLRVAVVGCIDPDLCGKTLTTAFGLTPKEPTDVIARVVTEARRKADLVVLVYHGTAASAAKLAAIPGVDLLLTAHGPTRLFPSNDSNKVEAPFKKQDAAIVVNAETASNWCLGRLDLQLATDHKIKDVKHVLLYLDRSYDEDPAMVKIYDAYNESVKRAVLTSSAEFKKSAEAMLQKRGLNLVAMRQRLHKSPFVGSDKCKDCHSEIHSIWAASNHARAMATLQKTHQEFDPECVRCHTTGASVRNGFSNFKDTPDLANVQCEACHGSAQEHIKAPAKGFGKSSEETCRSCHTDERTPDFDYDSSWAKIMH